VLAPSNELANPRNKMQPAPDRGPDAAIPVVHSQKRTVVMTTPQDAQQFIGRTAVDSEGGKLGKVGQVYLDDQTGQPVWVTVAAGMFGTRQSFAPIYGSRLDGDQIVLAVSKDLVKDAPSIDDDGQIDADEQSALYRHYSGYLSDSSAQAGGEDTRYQGEHEDQEQAGDHAGDSREVPPGQPAAGGRDASGPAAGDAMTRSEEQLRVGTETVEAGRARLRKYVVTENVTTTVPVSHEEVRVEREPVTDASRDAALSGEPLSEEEHEVTLRAERPVVEKEAVPVERVRLGTETVTEEQQVTEQVRKEQIEEPDVDPGPARDA
jgi:uncharacterized protein (TIGR02271 family)